MEGQLWKLILNAIVSGVLLGGVYVSATVGLGLAMGLARTFNLAHTAVALICGYLAYYLLTAFKVDPIVSIVALVPLMFLVGIGLWKFLLQPALARTVDPALSTSILTLGLAIAIENAASKVWTPNPRVMSTWYTDKAVELFGVTIQATYVIATVLAILVVAGLYWFLNYTVRGLAIQAAAQEAEGALLQGIDAGTMSMLAFALGTATAAVGDVSLGLVYSFSPATYFDWLLIALLMVIVGGAGTVLGTAISGAIVGVVLGLGGAVLPQVWSNIILFSLLVLILMLRPYGLFSR